MQILRLPRISVLEAFPEINGKPSSYKQRDSPFAGPMTPSTGFSNLNKDVTSISALAEGNYTSSITMFPLQPFFFPKTALKITGY